MDVKNIDFHELCTDEKGNFYHGIYGIDKNLFDSWIRENLKKIKTINSIEKVLPSEKLYKELCKLGYVHIDNQCHYSAKAVSIINPLFSYFTGFVETNMFPFNVIPHSFNVLNGDVMDLSRIASNGDLSIHESDSLPHTYYGIEIPRDFVLNYQEETMKMKSMKSLLYEWYMRNS